VALHLAQMPASDETISTALARGGSLDQSFSIPPSLIGKGVMADRAAEYHLHRDAAKGNKTMDTRALEAQKVRMPLSSHESVLQAPFWKDTVLQSEEPVAEALKSFHRGTEATLIHFVALPFVRRYEFVRRELQYAEACMELDALEYCESCVAEAVENGAPPVSDRQLVIWFLSRSAPYAGAWKRLVPKSSGGLLLKGYHDDGNAATLATVHRQLTVARSGKQVGLSVAIAGRPVTVPTAAGSMLLWYGWMPHASVDIGMVSRQRCSLHPPPDGLSNDERAYVTTYTRLGVERLAELVACLRANAGEGGRSPAPLLLVRAYAGV
jgi:hypothetical protein